MTIKRAPPTIVLTVENKRKFATFVSLFITINKQARGRKPILLRQAAFVKTTTAKGCGGQGSKNNGKTRRKYNNIGPWLSGPCFYLQLIYLEAIKKIIIFNNCSA